MPEFKPLFSQKEEGSFKVAHYTNQYAAEQSAKRNGEPVHFETNNADVVNASPSEALPHSEEAPFDEGMGEQAHGEHASELPNDEPIDVEALLEQARQEGIAEGRLQVEAELEAFQQQKEILHEALAQLETLHHQSIKAASRDVGELVSKITQQVLYDSLALHPNALQNLVADALNAMPENQKVWISVNPEQIETIKSMLNTDREVELRPDPSIEAGFQIHNQHSSIDSTLSTIMKGIEAAVTQWRESQ